MGTISTNICKLLISVYLMNQIYSAESQSIGQKFFRCKSGEYVSLTDFCDQTKDCTDGSDEPPSQCKQEKCTGEFLCASNSTNNFTCIAPKRICDTRPDCPDGSDELDCGDETNIKNCPLSKGKFLCKDNLRCLDLEYTCDGYCNCFDCSDENENCTKKGNQSLSQCSHSYFPTPSGLRCFCNPNDKTFESLCNEIKKCPEKNPCDQRCSMYKNKMLCSCNDDFDEILVSNGFKCRSRDYNSTMVIYSTANQIKSFDVFTRKSTVKAKNIQSKLLAAIRSNMIYYTTIRDDGKSIFFISSGGPREIIKTKSSISSISIDYITNNIYFTSNQSLSVCSQKGDICVQLRCCNVTTRVTVAPKFGWMFYLKSSDVPNEDFIMKSNMDGSGENILIDGTLRSVTTLAVDESFARLYWIDSTSRISSISLHDFSMERHYIKLGHDPVSMNVLDEIFFYSVDQDNKIYLQENLERFVKSSADKEEDEILLRRYYSYDRRPLPSDSNYTLYTDTNATISIKNIAVYNSFRQYILKSESPCSPNPCSGLCLIRPESATSNDTLGYTCACNGFKSTDGNPWCTDSSFEKDPPTTNRPLQDVADSGNSFGEIFFVLILLAVVLGGGYYIYQKFSSSTMYSRQSQPRIYNPDQDNI